jgi:type III pantothenate kinase
MSEDAKSERTKSDHGLLLTVDIGNTSLACGWFEGSELREEARFKTDAGRTSDEYVALLSSLLKARGSGELPKVRRAVVSSVVPQVTSMVTDAIKELFKTDALVVGPGIKTGMQLRVQEPQSLGTDRVVNALAARELYGVPALVIDFGTATAFDIIGADGSYEGSVIAAGPSLSIEALVMRTAKLSRVELLWPKSVVGKTTMGAMQSGAVIGYAGLLEGLISRIEQEVGALKHIIATGTHAELFMRHVPRIQHFEPHLTLHGLRLIAGLNS